MGIREIGVIIMAVALFSWALVMAWHETKEWLKGE
jgi:hypothetical protein